MTVLGAVWSRITHPNLERPFRMPLYPLPAIGFITIIGWTLIYTAGARPSEAIFACILIGVGAAIYAALNWLEPKNT